RLYAETCVITAGNELAADAFRLIVRHGGQSEDWSEGEEVAERVVSRGGARLTHLLDDVVAENRSPAHASRRRMPRAAHAVVPERAPCFPFKQYQPIRLFDRQRPQQHGVHDAEERSVRADPQGQREYSDDGESLMFEQHSHAVAQVLKHFVLQSTRL